MTSLPYLFPPAVLSEGVKKSSGTKLAQLSQYIIKIHLTDVRGRTERKRDRQRGEERRREEEKERETDRK